MIVAAIAAIVSICNGLGIVLVLGHLRTPSRTPIGKQVEDAHHTAIANNYRLQSLAGELGVTMPVRAAEQEAMVEELNSMRDAPSKGGSGSTPQH